LIRLWHLIRRASVYWFVKRSVLLDFKLFSRNEWSLATKYSFVLKKYWLILLHATRVRKFRLGKSKVKFNGRNLYYDSPLGLASYQHALVTHEFFVSQSKLRRDGVIVDVGANVGVFTMLLAEKLPEARIISFEPVYPVYRCLLENTKYFSNVEVENTALSNDKGEAFMDFDESNSVVSHISDRCTGVRVAVDTLDDVLAHKNVFQIDLLKVDVEMFEKHVLQGATRTLAQTKYLLMEITMEGNKEYTFAELVSLLYSDHYNFQLLALRNYSDVAEGLIPRGDFLFENVLFSD